MNAHWMILAALTATSGCKAQEPRPATPPPSNDGTIALLRFESAGATSIGNSGFDTPATLVISDSSAWRIAWQTIHAGTLPQPDLPQVDFAAETVLLVAIGQQPNGGHGVEITGVRRIAGDSLLVSAEHRIPGPECNTPQAIVEPVDIARIPRLDLPVRVEVADRQYSCVE